MEAGIRGRGLRWGSTEVRSGGSLMAPTTTTTVISKATAEAVVSADSFD